MDYRSIIESKYNRANWQGLIHDIFLNRVEFWQQPLQVQADESIAKRSLYLGKITLPDGKVIAIYEVELSDSVIIERNRAGIRNLLCANWRGMGCAGAFMFCFRQDESALRFSYVSESLAFTEGGALTKESTDTKRFTYLLGEGHRSRTAIAQFEELKKSSLDLQAITKAFSVEALSDIFFKEYKKQYEDIIEFVTGKRMIKYSNNKWEERDNGNPCMEIMDEFASFPNPEKAVRDYVKKLMGRLVFIQFLQKKGWMGCSAGDAWNDGDKEFVQNLYAKSKYKDTFVDDVLEPLFNDINTKREGDITSCSNVGENIKIPYLNGGLFEKDEYDKTSFALPAKYMKGLLDFFASYNFTIDENDPDDAEIGVDPEMLGRIFENLLEDNKDKGAFYTPKEIVQYMCRESLIQYLKTKVIQDGNLNPEDKIEAAVRKLIEHPDEIVPRMNEVQKYNFGRYVREVKICDPAIGSGAFPMGLLKELVRCRIMINAWAQDADGLLLVNDVAALKKEIICNCIYGVDIEKGAVDIARLRFWLSLIVEESTPHALPNMDFKIMQGNSLLEQFEGIDLSGMSLNEIEHQKAKKKRQEVWQQRLAFDDITSLGNIQGAIKEYYKTEEHSRKTELRQIINNNVKSYITNLKGCTPDIKNKIENLPMPNDKFFLWHIYFKEVFDAGGFDIVIANPPYIDSESMTSQGMDKLREILKNKYPSLEGNWDIYMAFLEFSLSMAKTVVFITPDKWLSKPFGKKFREIRMIERMASITRAGSKVFENATVDAIITVFISKSSRLCVSVFESENNIIKVTNKNIQSIKHIQDPYIIDYLFADNINVLLKIDLQNGKLKDLAECEGACATSDAYKLQPCILDKSIPDYNNEYIVINTGTISKYIHRWGMTPMKYLGNSYQFPVVNKCEFENNFGSTYIRRAKRPKLIFKGLNLLDVCIDEKAVVLPAKTTNVICSEDIPLLKFLCGVLNSKLISYYIKLKYSSSSYCGGITFTKDMINFIPININVNKSLIEKIVSQIVIVKRTNPLADTSSLEAEIDQLVYKLYDLTPDEIAIVEGSN